MGVPIIYKVTTGRVYPAKNRMARSLLHVWILEDSLLQLLIVILILIGLALLWFGAALFFRIGNLGTGDRRSPGE
jgi:hypothetical protein